MSTQNAIQTQWTLASFELSDAYTDFVLSRQAMQCSPATLRFYRFTIGKFLAWLETQSISKPAEVTARLVRAYLAELTARALKDTYIHSHARAIRTLCRFWHAEGYIEQPVKFDMPKLAKRRLPMLTAEQVQTVLAACNARDKALILFMVDTGLRRAEVVALNWQDVDMSNGLVTVKRGKGGKSRAAVLGATGRRALLAYRRHLGKIADTAPLFQTESGTRFTLDGFRQVFFRLAKKTGIQFSPHALRRTFCILALRSKMSPLHVQALLGHESLAMTQHYAQMVDDDLLTEHAEHSPADNLARLAKK